MDFEQKPIARQMAHPGDDPRLAALPAWTPRLPRTGRRLAVGKDEQMSDSDFLALGRQFLEALGAQDWAAMRALVTADVTWSFPGEARISGVAEGVDAVVAKSAAITSSG